MNTKSISSKITGDATGKAIVVNPGDGETLNAKAGAGLTFKIRSNQTNDALGIYEITLKPRTIGARLHYHKIMNETFIVMNGVLTLETAEGKVTVPKGGVVHVPHHTIHGFSNEAEKDVKIMLIFNPGLKREGFFYRLFELLDMENPDPADVSALNNSYDSVMI